MNENQDIKKAKEELDKISQDAKERRLAELREKAILDENTIRISGYNTGKKEGKEEGKKEVAKNLLKLNISIDDISKATGLSIDEINKLK